MQMRRPPHSSGPPDPPPTRPVRAHREHHRRGSRRGLLRDLRRDYPQRRCARRRCTPLLFTGVRASEPAPTNRAHTCFSPVWFCACATAAWRLRPAQCLLPLNKTPATYLVYRFVTDHWRARERIHHGACVRPTRRSVSHRACPHSCDRRRRQIRLVSGSVAMPKLQTSPFSSWSLCSFAL